MRRSVRSRLERSVSILQASRVQWPYGYLAQARRNTPSKALRVPYGFQLGLFERAIRPWRGLFQPSPPWCAFSFSVILSLASIRWHTSHLYTLLKQNSPQLPPTLPQLIAACLNATEPDLRPALLNNVVLTGGNSLLPGMADRINNELMRLAGGVSSLLFACLLRH
jgi:hypothetical protein